MGPGGRDVLITGAGPIGVMAVAICKYAGARNVVITDVNEYRLELAKKLAPTPASMWPRKKPEDYFEALKIKEGILMWVWK